MSSNFLFLILPSSQTPGPPWPIQSFLDDGLTSCFFKGFRSRGLTFSGRAPFPSWYLFSSSRCFIFSQTGSSSPRLRGQHGPSAGPCPAVSPFLMFGIPAFLLPRLHPRSSPPPPSEGVLVRPVAFWSSGPVTWPLGFGGVRAVTPVL